MPLLLKKVTLHVPDVTVAFTAVVDIEEELLSSFLFQAKKLTAKTVNAKNIFFIMFYLSVC